MGGKWYSPSEVETLGGKKAEAIFAASRETFVCLQLTGHDSQVDRSVNDNNVELSGGVVDSVHDKAESLILSVTAEVDGAQSVMWGGCTLCRTL